MTLKITQIKFALLMLFALMGGTMAFAQSNYQVSQLDQNEIISKCLTHELLFQETNINVDDISTFYILDHGVQLDFSPDLKINTKPVVLIQKNEINTLNGSPYFLFHTLNIVETTDLC